MYHCGYGGHGGHGAARQTYGVEGRSGSVGHASRAEQVRSRPSVQARSFPAWVGGRAKIYQVL